MNIPDKDWNAEKGIMEDTSLPEWQEYYKRLAEFRKRMKAKCPQRRSFVSDEDYRRAINEWIFSCSVDAPNKPGYYRAAND